MSLSEDPGKVAQAFLSALDDGRWSDAAELIDPETAERFRRQHVQLLRFQERVPGPAGPPMGDTIFRGPAEMAGVRSAAEMEALSPTELLARCAEAWDLARVMRGEGGADPEEAPQQLASPAFPRLLRRVLDCTTEDATAARVEYRTQWVEAEGQDPAPGEIHSFTLRYTPRGWRVRDADLTGLGSGRIWLSDEAFGHLRRAFERGHPPGS